MKSANYDSQSQQKGVRPSPSNKNNQNQKEELINNILILQRNILRFQTELEESKKTRLEYFKEYTEVTGKRFNAVEKRYNKLPAELKEENTNDKNELLRSMKEACAQDSKLLVDQVILRVEESKDAQKFQKQLQACHQHSITLN